MSKRVCLDAGHYGKYNRSPVVKDYYESDMNWKLHLLLKKYLEQYGVEVITTRTNKDKDLSLTSRGRASEGCDLFLSIHSNAASKESVDYPVVYVQLDGKGDALGNALASAIEYMMETKQGGRIEKRKGIRGEYYGVLRGAASVGTVGLILEHSFHTNAKAAKWLMDQNNLEELAKVEADIIAKHLGASKNVSVDLPVLKRGAKDGSVWSLQAMLLGFGYDLGTTGAKKDGVDGSFGGKTEEALKKYQFENDLDSDGSCGRKTWSSLLGID